MTDLIAWKEDDKYHKVMSFVSKEAIEVIAQSIGINNLSSDVAPALVPDVEYRLREIMQVVQFDIDWIYLMSCNCTIKYLFYYWSS